MTSSSVVGEGAFQGSQAENTHPFAFTLDGCPASPAPYAQKHRSFPKTGETLMEY